MMASKAGLLPIFYPSTWCTCHFSRAQRLLFCHLNAGGKVGEFSGMPLSRDNGVNPRLETLEAWWSQVCYLWFCKNRWEQAFSLLLGLTFDSWKHLLSTYYVAYGNGVVKPLASFCPLLTLDSGTCNCFDPGLCFTNSWGALLSLPSQWSHFCSSWKTSIKGHLLGCLFLLWPLCLPGLFISPADLEEVLSFPKAHKFPKDGVCLLLIMITFHLNTEHDGDTR